MNDYIDLTAPETNLEAYLIESTGSFNCCIKDKYGRIYKGFLLATSKHGNAHTFCDIDFQWSQKDQKYPPRLTFRRTNAQLQDLAVRNDKVYQRITFEGGQDGYREFWKMLGFLGKFKELVDLGEFYKEFRIVTKDSVVVQLKEKNEKERVETIVNYAIESGASISETSELLAHRSRKNDLEIFRKLLNDENYYRAKYREEFKVDIIKQGDEAVWHHFLKNHKWIFGLSLNLRFVEDFLDEQSIGNPDTENRGSPSVDMMGYNDYTVLIELKTPDTEMFTPTKSSNARTNTWSFSNEFIEGFSQCLAQKSDWQKSSDSKDIIKDEGDKKTILDRGIIRTIDPQAIFIVGNKEKEIPRDSKDPEIITKRDTLERFIRNNRNVNILSYDELYKRACYIVYGEFPASPKSEPIPTENKALEEINLDDILF